jgi:chemotaxis methyl-accepting protein methylase
MPYRFLHSKRLKSKVLIVAEARRIAKQMRMPRTQAFSKLLKVLKHPPSELEEPLVRRVCYTETAFEAN